MKKHIKLIIIILLAIVDTLSAQESNQMSDTWKPDFSNSHTRELIKLKKAQNQYTPAEFSKGKSYNIVNTKTKTNSPTHTILQNNNNHYNSHDVNQHKEQIVLYNTPTQIKPTPTHISGNTQLNDNNTVTTGDVMYALNRGDKPNDPSATPIGDALTPMLIFALCWIIYRLKTKN